MIELAQETQKKAQGEFRAVHGEKRKITEKLGERHSRTEKEVRSCAARRD